MFNAGIAVQEHTSAAAFSATLLFAGGATFAQGAPTQTTTTTRVCSPGGVLNESAIRADTTNASYQKGRQAGLFVIGQQAIDTAFIATNPGCGRGNRAGFFAHANQAL